MSHTYSGADGDILAGTFRAGVLHGKVMIPAVFFHLRPDRPRVLMEERIPFWAIDRLAAVVYAYVITTQELTGNPSAFIQANVKADIRSDGLQVMLQAFSVRFHTSRNIHDRAEERIQNMTLNGHWPNRAKLTPPLDIERRSADRAPRVYGDD